MVSIGADFIAAFRTFTVKRDKIYIHVEACSPAPMTLCSYGVLFVCSLSGFSGFYILLNVNLVAYASHSELLHSGFKFVLFYQRFSVRHM